MSEQRTSNVSVVIVCWNSAAFLPRCLQSLIDQTYRDFEVIVVDNASTDGATSDLPARYPALTLRLERLDQNRGFAAANNVGARLARGPWLALLNPDAFPQPDWLEQLITAAASHPSGFFASRQIQADRPGFLDGEGDWYHVSGLAWRHNYNQPVGRASGLEEPFSACAAAALYPRHAFLEAGGFDEDYFAYFEDVDLGFRLRLLGLRCFYVPEAVVHHVGSASSSKGSDLAVYHGHRNLVWTYFKDMPGLLFWLYLPLHVATNLYLALSLLVGDGRPIVLRAKLDALRGLPSILRKRPAVQRSRRISYWSLYSSMRKNLLEPRQASRLAPTPRNHN